TNPTKEEQEYIDAIVKDVRWLGFDYGGDHLYASDYFEQMFAWAEVLIRKGKAYVCDLSAAQIREYRGTLTQPRLPRPWRGLPGLWRRPSTSSGAVARASSRTELVSCGRRSTWPRPI